MTTTIERFHVDSDSSVGGIYYEQNADLTVHLSLGGEDIAQHAERGIVVVYLGVDGGLSQVAFEDGMPRRGSVEVLDEAIERLTTVRNELQRLR